MTYEPRIALKGGAVSLSRLVFGAWRLLDQPQRPSAQDTARLIAAAVDLGLTSFDHADIYGNYQVEAAFGEGLAAWGGARRSIELITKCDIMLKSAERPANRLKHYNTGAAHIVASVEQSLKNLGTDYIDVLLLHRPDPLMDADETARGLELVVKAGKVRAIGVSNFMSSQFDLLQSRLSFPLVTNQIEMSVLHTAPLTDGTLDHAQQHCYAPMIWSPLGGGSLFTGQGEREFAPARDIGEAGGRGRVGYRRRRHCLAAASPGATNSSAWFHEAGTAGRAGQGAGCRTRPSAMVRNSGGERRPRGCLDVSALAFHDLPQGIA